MIDDSLLFQMGYLFPDIAISHVVISLFFGTLLAFLLTRPKRVNPPPEGILPLPVLPKSDAPDFEEALALVLRTYLAREYVPHHARAHTASEIARYAPDHPLLQVLSTIEAAEYSSKHLSPSEREALLGTVERYTVRPER